LYGSPAALQVKSLNAFGTLPFAPCGSTPALKWVGSVMTSPSSVRLGFVGLK